jgi:hypothetical protein
MGASRFDVIRLATPEYHIDMDGTDNLTEDTLQVCGYSTIKATVDDVMVCYNDIILVHHKVMELWYNAYTHTSGPQVDKVLQKSLTVFPKLCSMRVEDVVGFYDHLQEVTWDIAWRSCRLMLWSSRTASRDYAPRAWVSFDMLPCVKALWSFSLGSSRLRSLLK